MIGFTQQRRLLKKRWGKRCADFEGGCYTCQAWRYWDQRLRVPAVRSEALWQAVYASWNAEEHAKWGAEQREVKP